MAFHKSPMPRQSPMSFRNKVLFAIGRHAFIHLPPSGAEGDDFIACNDSLGTGTATDPKDGQEVCIIAWRPQSPQGLVYQVSRLSDGREWWAKAMCLRKTASAATVEP